MKTILARVVLFSIVSCATSVYAADVYWDINGTTAGANAGLNLKAQTTPKD